MSITASAHRRLLGAFTAAGAIVVGAGLARAQEPVPASPAQPSITVDAQVALHSVMSLSDGHLQKLADALTVLASSDAARSADWERIREPLAVVARMNVPAVHWFALADGSYWTLEKGRTTENLSERPYFPRAVGGETIVGELVVSHSTNRNTAIVAVPVRGQDDTVIGVLGSSVHLDSLTTLLRRELGGLQYGLVFFAIDSQPLGALNSDTTLIFTTPTKLGDEGMRRAFTEMLASEEGVVAYDFRGGRRTVFYRRSPVTGWWYGFGVIGQHDVLLGGLFSLTGAWSPLGETGHVAMEMAVADLNRYLTGNAAGVRFGTAIEDTRMDPGVALEKAQALHARGVQLLIGPQTSAEVERLKPFVDANDVLLISPSSTAGSLAIAGDNVFRFTPSDRLEGVAVSALMWEDGIRTVVPVWREDAGNAGLEAATRARFGSLGGTVLEGISYSPGTPDFGALVAALETRLRPAIARHGAEGVGVYLAGFDEVVGLFAVAAANPILGSVRWYGSDGMAHNEGLLANPQAVAFATRTGYPNPAFGLEEGAREIWEPLVERITARTGKEPDALALGVYDAVWAVGRAYIASGATRNIEKLKQAFTTAAASGYGATGWLVLDETGDRRHGDFDFWAVRVDGGVPRWTRVARYESRTERLVPLDVATEERRAESP